MEVLGRFIELEQLSRAADLAISSLVAGSSLLTTAAAGTFVAGETASATAGLFCSEEYLWTLRETASLQSRGVAFEDGEDLLRLVVSNRFCGTVEAEAAGESPVAVSVVPGRENVGATLIVAAGVSQLLSRSLIHLFASIAGDQDAVQQVEDRLNSPRPAIGELVAGWRLQLIHDRIQLAREFDEVGDALGAIAAALPPFGQLFLGRARFSPMLRGAMLPLMQPLLPKKAVYLFNWGLRPEWPGALSEHVRKCNNLVERLVGKEQLSFQTPLASSLGHAVINATYSRGEWTLTLAADSRRDLKVLLRRLAPAAPEE